MTMQDDPNIVRRPVDPLLNRDATGRKLPDERGLGWGVPAALVAGAIILGIFFMMPKDTRTTTANNTSPQVSTSTPAPTPPATPPAKTQ